MTPEEIQAITDAYNEFADSHDDDWGLDIIDTVDDILEEIDTNTDGNQDDIVVIIDDDQDDVEDILDDIVESYSGGSDLSLNDVWAYLVGQGWGAIEAATSWLDSIQYDQILDTLTSQSGALSLLDGGLSSITGLIIEAFDGIGIDLVSTLDAVGTTIDTAFDTVGTSLMNIKNDLGNAIDAGLDDAGLALSTIAGQMAATAGGMLDAAMDLVSPLVEGLTTGFMALISGFSNMLSFTTDDLLNIQDELQGKLVERQLADLNKRADRE